MPVFTAQARCTATSSPTRAPIAGQRVSKAAWHFRPYRSLDPWIGFGAGYRTFLVNAPAGSSLARHAVDVARLAVGIDYRFNAAIAVGPVIGVDLALFLGDGGDATASSTGLSTFVMAGIAARFDFG